MARRTKPGNLELVGCMQGTGPQSKSPVASYAVVALGRKKDCFAGLELAQSRPVQLFQLFHKPVMLWLAGG